MRYFRQWVVLIHKLRELARAKELFNGRRNRLGVNHLLRHQAFGLGLSQTLFHCALDTNQTDAKCIFGHLANTTDTAVTQMIDIIHRAKAIANINQGTQDVEDVLVTQYARTGRVFTTYTAVELHPTHGRQIVAICIEEQVVKQVLGCLFRWRLARAHHAVNLYQRFQACS